MNITVTIGGVDKSSLVEWGSFRYEDNVNQQPNTCSFIIKTYTGQSYKPAIGDSVVATDGSDKIFSGTIIRVRNYFEADIAYYQVTVKDETLKLDRVIVTESFDEETVNDIIDYINTNYLSGVTITNVDCDIEITRIVFNKKTVTQCLNDLAKLTNYIWYIDYDSDIHFIAKNSEASPFNISDDSDYIIGNSLDLNSDLSQLRNVVTIRGADKVATNTRDKNHTGDGTTTAFNTDYKFAELPIVTVNGSPVTVGVENLDTTGYDCYWNYNQKYIRFGTAPTDTHPIVITGYPEIPIIVQIEDLGSISQFGRYEFSKVNKDLKSSEDAQLYAQAQLESYAQSVREGSFRTYESGLKSGQTLSINLTDLGIADQFIIQRVALKMITRTKGEWTVELATTQTMGIIQFLQDKLLSNDNLELNEDEVLEKYYIDSQRVQVTEEVEVLDQKEDHQDVEVTEDLQKDPFGAGVHPDFVLCPYTPTGQTDKKREFMLNRSYLG
ncbi:MAG: hypothetical protein EOL88_00510 [Bacteroidia bacterium]|nr:hypothetical protein [Bacteroidia bacterium]